MRARCNEISSVAFSETFHSFCYEFLMKWLSFLLVKKEVKNLKFVNWWRYITPVSDLKFIVFGFYLEIACWFLIFTAIDTFLRRLREELFLAVKPSYNLEYSKLSNYHSLVMCGAPEAETHVWIIFIVLGHSFESKSNLWSRLNRFEQTNKDRGVFEVSNF